MGEFRAEIPLIISNHDDHADIAREFGIAFHHLPITPETKAEQESRAIKLLEEARVDLVVLARYMQVLGEGIVDAFAGRIINIHHSFLPAFAGARPYHQAHERGVKIIGATAHYVTPELDQGPIIEQDVAASATATPSTTSCAKAAILRRPCSPAQLICTCEIAFSSTATRLWCLINARCWRST